jgi:ribosomal protein S12 methylthiotransferase
MKIALITLGCPKNLVDAEVMLGILDRAGHTLVASPDGADLAIVNTCSFIAAAVEESTEVVAGCLDLKADGRLGHVIVAGCMPQRYGEGIYTMLPGVDGVVGCSDVASIGRAITAVERGERVTAVNEPLYLYDHSTPRVLGTPDHLAYVKIAEGCDNRCAYCMIPSIRGRLRSREPDSVLREVEDLVETGIREVNLIAQDTTAYGMDIAPHGLLPELLAGVDSVGAQWVRLLYTHPAHLTDAVIDSVASLDSVVPYLDIPIQHIADHLLTAMGRGTSGSFIRGLIERVRAAVPGIWIRSSVIVGLPGERERDFDELMEYVRSGPIDHLGVFEFSPEQGTRAAGLPDQVESGTASLRARALMDLTQSLATARGRTLADRELTVLVDSVDGTELTARHAGQAWELDGVIRMKTPGNVRRGDFLPVRITGASGFDLDGVVARRPATRETA